ncbi:MAG: hypothetical protein IH840_05565 [Candidatus Heimdallarchaeota archaeon]|nr:hypothetical protein [Candidatus Heimdallarchaeota archaeon]
MKAEAMVSGIIRSVGALKMQVTGGSSTTTVQEKISTLSGNTPGRE